MFLENTEKDKKQWRENERRMRKILIWMILSVIAFVIILVFFHSYLWALVVNAAVIVGLIADLISIVKHR